MNDNGGRHWLAAGGAEYTSPNWTYYYGIFISSNNLGIVNNLGTVVKGSHAISTGDPTDNCLAGYCPNPDNHFPGIFYSRYQVSDSSGVQRGSSWYSAENPY